MDKKEAYLEKRYIFWAIIASLVILSFLILKEYIIPIVSAFVLAYLTKPLFSFMSKFLGKTLSALLCVLLVLLIIILPLGLIVGGITKEAYNSISSLNQESIKATLGQLFSYPIIKELNINVQELASNALSLLISLFASLIFSIPSLLISLFITLFGMYCILTNWNYLASRLKDYIPFENKEKTIKDVAEATDNIVYGNVLIALMEFVFALAGFLLLGISYPFLYSALVGITAFIPAIGAGFVWIPLAIYYLVTSSYLQAVGIIIIGLIIGIIIENIIKFKILGRKTKINPFIMLIGIFGGVSLFGIFGFIIGPLILAYTIKLIEQAIMQR